MLQLIWFWLKYLDALWSVSLPLGHRTPSSPAAPSGRQSARTGPPTAPAPADSRPAPSGTDGSGAPAPGRRHPSGPPSAASPGRSGAPQKAIFQSRVARRRLRPAAARCRLSDSRRRSWLRAVPSPELRGPRCRGEVEPGHCRRCRGHTGAPGRCHIHRRLIVGDSESDCRDKGTEGGAGATPGSDVCVIFTID